MHQAQTTLCGGPRWLSWACADTRALLAHRPRTVGDDRALAEQICRACVDGLGIDGAAISLLTAGELRETLWASDATADLMEDLQFSLGEGPCVEAATSGRPVLAPDISDTHGDQPVAGLRRRRGGAATASAPSSRFRCNGVRSTSVSSTSTAAHPGR